MSKKVRVRFAPSPTGGLHIGGVRTALYNYLFAKKNGGDFILRIEDTDQSRFVPGAEDFIKNSLDWLGLTPDESPWNGGDFGPYRQSERKGIYSKYAQQLLDEGKAYYAFDTSEEISEMKSRLEASGVVQPQYNGITRTSMKNSLTLSSEEVKTKLDAGEPYVIRLKVPTKEEVRLNDIVRGWVKILSTEIDDKILIKSGGMPTYHLANVVDDHLMEITHVIRGEEWLPSSPCHVLLYEYLGWADSMPEFAHLPLLLKPDGNGKLSKRSADKMGFPIFPLNWTDPKTGELSEGFKEKGFLPEALTNFLAMLGWNPGTDEEFFSLEELVNLFSEKRITKAGTKFDIDKLKWFNQHYIKETPDEILGEYVISQAKEAGLECTKDKATRVANILKERVTFPNEFLEKSMFLFTAPESYDEKIVKKKWNAEVAEVISKLANSVESSVEFSGQGVKDLLGPLAEEKGWGIGKVMQPLRMAVSGAGNGPELVDILDILGKEEIVERLNVAVNKIPLN